MAKDWNRHYFKDIQQLTGTKKCSILLIIKEMHIITTISYHLTPVRMVIIKKQKREVLAVMWRKGNLCALLVEMEIGEATTESSMEGLQK